MRSDVYRYFEINSKKKEAHVAEINASGVPDVDVARLGTRWGACGASIGCGSGAFVAE